MADINVERRGPSVWPWVIGLLVLALLIWVLVEMFGDAGEPVMVDPVTAPTDAGPAAGAVTPPPLPLPPDSLTSVDATSDTVPSPADTLTVTP